jgi:hypothetical protein
MSFVPAGLVASLAKQVVNGEGQPVIYRRVTHSINTSTGVATATNVDTALRAVVSGRESKFIDGTLVRLPGEKVIIAASDLATEPEAGDVVILAAADSASVRRRVINRKLVGTQGVNLAYVVEVEP